MIRESNLPSGALSAPYESSARADSDSGGWMRRPGLSLPLVLLVTLVTGLGVGYLHFGDRVGAYQL